MRFLIPVLLSLALSAHADPIEPFSASAPLTLELSNAQWFDGQQWKRGTLYVADGVFTAQKPKRVNRSMSLKGQFLVPPLAEASNHNLQNDWGISNFEPMYLRDGVFYAAMFCADPAGVEPIRGRLNQADSPDVIFSTACVTSSDGQPLAALPPGSTAVLTMDNPAEIERKWPQLLARANHPGDWVTVTLSYHERGELRRRPELKGRLGMDADVVATVTERAHKAGLKVAAHVDSAADFVAAVDAGVDLITDLPGYFNPYGDGPERFALTRDEAESAARHRVAVITTTSATTLFKTTSEQLDMLRQTQAANLRLLKDAGVTLLLGSDMLMNTALAEAHNLDRLQVFKPNELLALATISTPRTLFPKRKLGCFEPGCEASFLLLGEDPLQDINALDTPLLRVKQGRLLSQSEDVAESSDKTSISTDAAAKSGKGVKKGRTTHKASDKAAAKKSVKPAAKAASSSTAKTATQAAAKPASKTKAPAKAAPKKKPAAASSP